MKLKNGYCGTCSWTVGIDGTLVIAPIGNRKEGVLADTDMINIPWVDATSDIRHVRFEKKIFTSKNYFREAFFGCKNLESVDFSNLIIQAKDISNMFYGTGIVRVNFAGMDLSSVQTMNGIFKFCAELESVDFSNANLKKLLTMDSAFEKCPNLKKVSFKGADLSHLAGMQYAFRDCSSLEKVDFSNVQNNSAWDFHETFKRCPLSLKADMSSFSKFTGFAAERG